MIIDDLIADVASEITSSVAPDLLARVRDRIDAADRRSRCWKNVIGAKTGLVAGAAVSMLVVRSSSPRPLPAPRLPIRADAHFATPVPVIVEQRVVTPAAAPTIASRKRAAPSIPVIPTAEQEWLARAVPALENTKPL